MTKNELLFAVNQKLGSKIKEEVINAVLESISEALKKGEDVTLRGFGTFTIKVAKERIAQDMNKGKSVVIPEHKVVKFKPSIELKDGVAKS